MKKISFYIFLFLSIGFSKNSFSQQVEKADSLGLPGDNLNLYAVLDLFQKSETFEIFEKQLNSEDSKINNLDLNNDDKIDYIKVVDHQTGESHAIVLQVIVNEKETQDVAVIEIDKDKSRKVVVQIVGNEELYGKDYIVEPTENDPTATADNTQTKSKSANPNTKSDTTVSSDGKTVIINNTTNNYNTTNNNSVSGNSPDYIYASNWPIIHHVYAPTYVVYVSPWYWSSYPMWWNPWTPWYWHNYYWHHYEHYHYHHYGYYHRTNYYRAPVANAFYGPRRSVSVTVQGNRKAAVYQKTYDSKNRVGDGRVKAANSNPAYKEKPESKGNNNNASRQKPNDGMNKSAPKQNDNGARNEGKPAKNENSTPRQNNKPNTKPANKPAQRQGGGGKSGGSKSGGGRMGR